MVSEVIFPCMDILFIMRYKMDNKNIRHRRKGHEEGKHQEREGKLQGINKSVTVKRIQQENNWKKSQKTG